MLSGLIDELLSFDVNATASAIQSFISEIVESSGASGVVLGLSGGVDSAVVAAMCAKSLPRKKVLGLIMPTDFTPTRDVEDARAVANLFGIETRFIPITSIVESYASQLGVKTGEPAAKIPYANLRARVRMTLLYFTANLNGLLVAGTGDRSEILLGYYTKYGDGAVDFLPIGNIYKTQLRRLAVSIGLPEHIAYKPSSPQLYPGHRATDELPADYEVLDQILYLLFDRHLSVDAVVEKGFERKVVEQVWALHVSSSHKRAMPPVGPRPSAFTR